MSKDDVIDVIVRQYGGVVSGGINWSWALFAEDYNGKAAFDEVTRRFPEIDHRGYYAKVGEDGGFRYRF